jgi:hypothetical protein
MRVAIANWPTNIGFKAECPSSVGGSELNSEVLLEYAANLIEASATKEQADQRGRSFPPCSPFIVIFAAPAAVANSLGSQLGGGIENGTDDLVVAGAPA